MLADVKEILYICCRKNNQIRKNHYGSKRKSIGNNEGSGYSVERWQDSRIEWIGQEGSGQGHEAIEGRRSDCFSSSLQVGTCGIIMNEKKYHDNSRDTFFIL